MSVPRVSVVVPAYNSERYLPATLESVCAQTLTAWELIVFDDGSTDGTVASAREFERVDPRIRVIEATNEGVASARNRGFAAASGGTEFVIFLDNDDVWEPDILETLVADLDAHPAHVSAHSIARCIDEHGRQPPDDDMEEFLRNRKGFGPDGIVTRSSSDPTTFADLANWNWPFTPGLHLVRREVLEAAGGFDPDAVPCDDWDMNVRISRHGDIGFVGRPLLHWRRHASAQSNKAEGWRRSHFHVRRKMLTDPRNTPQQLRAARLGYRQTSSRTSADTMALLGRRDYRGAIRRFLTGWNSRYQYARALGHLHTRR